MGGRPVLNKLVKDIEAMGGDEVIFERIAGGDTITGIAAELGVSRPFLSARLNRNALTKKMLAEALLQRASAWAEQTLEIAEGVEEEKSAIDKAKLRIDTRKWLAAIEDPDKYGNKGTAVNVSIGGLHLAALQQVQQETIEGSAVDVTPPDDPAE